MLDKKITMFFLVLALIYIILNNGCLPVSDTRSIVGFDASLINSIDYSHVKSIAPPIAPPLLSSKEITIVFYEEMTPTSLRISGSMDPYDNGGKWSTTTYANDTLKIKPISGQAWPAGTQNLIINVKNSEGISLPVALNLEYEVTAVGSDIDYLCCFDMASTTNLFGGVIGTFASGAPDPEGEVSGAFDSSNAFRDKGYAYKIDYDVSTAGSYSAFYATFDSSGLRDLSDYKFLSFWIKHDQSGVPPFKLQFKDENWSADELYIANYIDGGLSTTWKNVIIPLDSFLDHINGTDLDEMREFTFVLEESYATANGYPTSGTCYIDEIGLSTDAINYVRIDHFNDNYNYNCLGAACSDLNGDGSHVSSYSSSTYNGYANSLRSAYNTGAGWCGYDMPFSSAIDFSNYTKLTLSIKSNSIPETPAKIKIELHDDGAWPWPCVYIPDDTVEGTAISTDWTNYTINLSSFYDSVTPAYLDPSSIEKLVIVYDTTVVNTSGVVFFDNMQFEK